MSHHPNSASRTPSSIITPGLRLALLALLGTGLAACSQQADVGKASPAAPTRPVLVADAQSSSSQGPEFIGEVRARQRAELAFALPGLVRQVLVEPGDAVKRGQLLASLDLAPTQAQLGAAQAEIQRLQAGLDEARRRHQRLQAAREQQAASEAEWSAVQADLRMAEAALAAAQSQRENTAWNRVQAELRAPFDGVIAARQLEVGQTVGSGLAVITMDGAGRELWALLPPNLKGLNVGQRAALLTPEGELDSRLLRLSARQEAGGARRAVFELPAQARVGDTLSIRLQQGPAAANGPVWVPLRAVEGPGAKSNPQVLRLKADGQSLERVDVRLGATQGDRVEVLAGLKAGERVVLAGGHSLAADARVKPVSSLR
ncbi:RND family efflux transporter MFP subunit [Paucibacter oligotrophus]|uniref:RND family efflux transporter MFP subunit n=1 Tax=Roseateles oligotrophus TaxID=1769250 RepID=A0A840LCA3_9BURK|nr:efflux RND transporter periplasmic adaptor subunit [Roseateles oligotrophus]MBB4845361.1 RND family efflux transporter MFP subunit [Roseateles oligotrophus]